jgi:Fic family protein
MKRLSYENVSRTTRITASRNLNDLVEKGVMQRFGSGRGVYCELGLE